MAKGKNKIKTSEIGSTYVSDTDRFVVSLVVGYSDSDLGEGSFPGETAIETAMRAARAALSLTSDDGSSGTNWYVFDRQTKEMYLLEQGEFE